MLTEKFFNFIVIIFIGIMGVYYKYTPPKIIIKYPNINDVKNIMYFEEKDSNKCKL
jgi:hypothetical protein